MTRQALIMCIDDRHEDQAIVTLESLKGKQIDHIQKIIFALHQPSDEFIEYATNQIEGCMIVRIEDDLTKLIPSRTASSESIEDLALRMSLLHSVAITADMGYDLVVSMSLNAIANTETVSEMFRVQMNDSYLAATSHRTYDKTSIDHFYESYEERFEARKELCDQSGMYFNEGVLVWNVAKLAEDNLINDDFIRLGYLALERDVDPVRDYLNRFFNGRSMIVMPRQFNALPDETVIPFIAYNMAVGHQIKLSQSAVINFGYAKPWDVSIRSDKLYLQLPITQYWEIVEKSKEFLSEQFISDVRHNYEKSKAMCGSFIKPLTKLYGKPLN